MGNFQLYLTLLFTNLAPLELGYNLAVTNLVEPYVKCWINEVQKGVLNQTICDLANDTENEWLQNELDTVTLGWALCTSIFAIGAAIGGLTGGLMADKFGRKTVMIANATFVTITCVILGGTRMIGSYALLVVMRLFAGINCGISSSVAPAYLNEIAPESKLGVFGTSFQLTATSGQLLGMILTQRQILGTNQLWTVALFLGIVPPVLQILLSFFVPESPKWLARNKSVKQAIDVEVMLKGDEAQVGNLTMIFEMNAEPVSLIQNIQEIFANPPVKAALFQAVAYHLTQQLSGINAIIFYSGNIFLSAGIPPEWSGLCTAGVGLVNVLGVVAATLLIKKLGRMTLFFWGNVLMTIFIGVTPILLSFDSQVISYISVAPILLYVFTFELGSGPMPWMLTAELVPSQYSAGAAAIGSSINWSCCFLVGMAFPPLSNAIDQYVFIIFFVFCLISCVYIRKYGVETKDKTIEEVQEEFKKRL